MFQKFNSEMNEITKRRSVIDQIVLKKEKDIEEKDQILFEKINAIEESDRLLNMRQAEIDAFEQLLKTFNEKKEQLRNEMLKLDEQIVEKKNSNDDMKLEAELILKKRTTVEQSLQELVSSMNQKFVEAKEKRSKIEKDVKVYEEKVDELNQRFQSQWMNSWSFNQQ